jgi:hypothetical protein
VDKVNSVKETIDKEKAKKMTTMILPPLLLELENNPKYDFIRQNSEFQQLLAEYRLKCESVENQKK